VGVASRLLSPPDDSSKETLNVSMTIVSTMHDEVLAASRCNALMSLFAID
jgi:hypothetical protein